VREHALELVDLSAKLRVARLRLTADPLQPPLDVITVGDEQLQLELLDLLRGADDEQERVDLPQVAEQLGAGTRDVDAGVTLRERSTAATRGSRSSAIGAIPTCSRRSCPCAPALVRALKSEVLPAPGRPTMPTARATAGR
jgi:hypothetical protein